MSASADRLGATGSPARSAGDIVPAVQEHTSRQDEERAAAAGDRWVRAWPLNRPAVSLAVKGGLALLVVGTAVGLVFMWFLDDGPIGDADRSWARWLEEHRTASADTFTHYGSMLSETLVKVLLIVVVGGAMVILWRRWHDGVFLALAVVIEASVFVVTSFVVGRDRPPVVHLDPPAPSGSFPSGHTAAAVAFYAGVYLVVRWHTTNRAVRAVFLVIGVVAPLIVGFSRAYRGMHHPIDVTAGLVLGVAALWVARAALVAGATELGRRHPQLPDRLRRLDLSTPPPEATDRDALGSSLMTSSTFTAETGSRKVEELAHRHPALVTVARLGWVAKGVVYLVVGLLAVPIALRGLGSNEGGDEEASQSGAIGKIAGNSFGTLALWVIAIGLGLYVIWRLISILLPAENSAKAWFTRFGYLVSVLTYSALVWSAVSFARHRQSTGTTESEDSRVERITRDVMEQSGGRWLVGAVGVVMVAVGLYFVVKGLRAKFRDELEPGAVGPFSHEAIVTLGRVGWIGRGIVMGLVGWFLVRAAVRFRPEEAYGFDGALREATSTTLGAVLVLFAAIALGVYGLFCAVSAPRQRLIGAD